VAPLFTAAGGLKLVTNAHEIGAKTNALQIPIKRYLNIFVMS
jgi:hypothetical protein